MKTSDLITALNRLKVQTGSFACLGCGYEHNCSTQGCRLIREAVDELCWVGWIDAEVELPPDDGKMVLVIASGKPTRNVTLNNAIELATYYATDGWVLESWPEWENPNVTHWMLLPEPPEE